MILFENKCITLRHKIQKPMKKLIFITLAALLVITACGKKQAPASIYSHDWELYEVISKDATGDVTNTETPPMGITLTFSDSLKMASGHSGCNRYSMPFEEGEQNTIMFGMSAMTQMACPDMEFENRYLGWLMSTESYLIDDDELRLEVPGAELTMVYKPEFK